MVQELKSKLNPRDVANQAEAMVINLPQSILLALLELTTSCETKKDSKLSFHLEKISDATKYLNSVFIEDFGQLAGSVSEELEQATQTLFETLKTLNHNLCTLGAEPEKTEVLALASQTQDVISPAIGSFLGALFTQVVAFEKASAKRAQDVDSVALAHIDGIARQITFIAINASIEAARVGAAGKAFSVIASEIKTLSEEAKKAVEGIRVEMADQV